MSSRSNSSKSHAIDPLSRQVVAIASVLTTGAFAAALVTSGAPPADQAGGFQTEPVARMAAR